MSATETEPTGAEPDNKSEFTAITNQAELDKAIGPRLERERAKFADYKDLKAKADKFDELEAANKTEVEKAVAERDTAKAELDRERLEIKRLQLANEHGISGEYLELFTGSSIEDLEAKAPKIAALIPTQTDTPDNGIRELVVTAEGKSPAALASDPLAAMLTQAVQ